MKRGVFPGEKFAGLGVVINGCVYLDTAQVAVYDAFKNDVFPFPGREFDLQGIQRRSPKRGDVRIEVEKCLASVGELLPDRLLPWVGQWIGAAYAHIAAQRGHDYRSLVVQRDFDNRQIAMVGYRC